MLSYTEENWQLNEKLYQAGLKGTEVDISEAVHSKGISILEKRIYPTKRDYPDGTYCSVLDLLAINNHLDLLEKLIDDGADVNIRDKSGLTLIGVLASSISRSIYTRGIPPEEQQRRNKINEIIQKLIAKGAIIQRKDLSCNVKPFQPWQSLDETIVQADKSCSDTKQLLQTAFDVQPTMLKAVFDAKKDAFDLKNALFLAEISSIAYQAELEIKAHGTEGCSFVIQSSDRKFQGLVLGSQDMIVVCFRGTEMTNFSNWKKNVNIAPKMKIGHTGKHHSGFDSALSTLWDQVYAAIQQLRENFSRDNPHLWFTGHSLGGAMAVLAADRYTDLHPEAAKLCHVYTFGAPLVGDQDFSMAFNQKLGTRTYLVQNKLDPVPNAVPVSLGYRSLGDWRLIDENLFLYNDDNYYKSELGHLYDQLQLTHADEKARWIAALDQSGREIEYLVRSDVGMVGETNNLVATGLHTPEHGVGVYIDRITQMLKKQQHKERITNNAAMRYRIKETVENRDKSYLVQYQEHCTRSFAWAKANPLKTAGLIVGGAALLSPVSFKRKFHSVL